jgi:hypothetical protein
MTMVLPTVTRTTSSCTETRTSGKKSNCFGKETIPLFPPSENNWRFTYIGVTKELCRKDASARESNSTSLNANCLHPGPQYKTICGTKTEPEETTYPKSKAWMRCTTRKKASL